jgi:hypothetical protein
VSSTQKIDIIVCPTNLQTFEDKIVQETFLHGKLHLSVKDNKLYERYSGGLLGYLGI